MYSLLFYGYAFFAAPLLARSVEEALKTPEIRFLPAAALLVAFICETIAMPLKFASWGTSAGKREETTVPLALGSVVGICHVILSFLLCFYMLDALGVMGSEEMARWQEWVLGISFMIVFTREFYLFFITGSAMRSWKVPGKAQMVLANVMMLIFQCIAYTVYWDTMFGSEAVRNMHWVATLFVGAGLILVFYIMYLPLRMTDVFEVYFLEGGTAGRRASRTMFITGAILGAYPVLAGWSLSVIGR